MTLPLKIVKAFVKKLFIALFLEKLIFIGNNKFYIYQKKLSFYAT